MQSIQAEGGKERELQSKQADSGRERVCRVRRKRMEGREFAE